MSNAALETFADCLIACKYDPVLFNELWLNRPPYWSRKKELCASVVRYRVTPAYSGNMVGKNYCIAGCILWWLTTRSDSLCIITGPSQTVLGSVTFKEIRRCLEGAVIPFEGKISQGIKASPAVIEIASGWQAWGFSTTSVERSSGQHCRHLLAVVEEASGVEDFVFDAIDSLGYERLVCIGNPIRSTGRERKRAEGATRFLALGKRGWPPSPHRGVVFYGAAIAVFFSPFVKFVQFVAIEIRIAPIGVWSQTSGQIRLMF